MKKITVLPLIGFANITFGMQRERVRKLLDGFKMEFPKAPFSPQLVDDFGYCHVFYDCDNKCEAVEFFSEVEIQIGGEVIVPGKLEDIKLIITDLVVEEEGFWISKSKSVGITESKGTIETILFGCPNYYL